MASSDQAIKICDVSPRDGLQNLDRIFSIDEKIILVEQLIGAGLRNIEVGSFVNPARVPQMAGIEDVLNRINQPEGTCFAALTMNAQGADRALACGIDELRYVIVASEVFSQRNQGSTIKEAEAEFSSTTKKVHAHDRTSTAVIAAAFGCPYSGNVDPDFVQKIAIRAVEAGANAVIFADTIGAGVPAQVTALCKNFRRSAGDIPFGFHFHNTRNTGYANAFAAVAGGASILDASTGGIGGCPFAPGATGNIATEDLLYMLQLSGVETGLDATALLGIVDWLTHRIPDKITGQLSSAGFFPALANSFSKPQKEIRA
jgi:hydroxymethylglutaryl-CoA lyase